MKTDDNNADVRTSVEVWLKNNNRQQYRVELAEMTVLGQMDASAVRKFFDEIYKERT